MKPIFKRLLSCVLSATMAVSAIPIVSAHAAEGAESYPYTMFAASSAEGAITINSGNFCVNGNVATNGTIISSGNMNVNGIRAENADESMIFIFNRIDNQYFSASNVDEHNEDYTLEELNININVPTEVQGEATLTGNININNALKALEDINLYGEVKNTNESVIFSKYGDIIIDSQNVNLNGLVYAPFGSVTITAQNLNLNNVVIIAERIVLTCPNVNANNSSNVSSFVGTASEPLDIPYDEWQYMKDEDENDFPDFFENPDNWRILKDTDGDQLPDCVEQFIGTDAALVDSDGDMLNDYYEVFLTGTDPVLPDTDNNGVADGDEDFDTDGLTNYQEYVQGTPLKSSKTVYNDDGTVKTVKGYYFIMKSDPRKEDTDGDGINDYKETNGLTFTNPEGNENEYEGEPLKKGLADGIVGNLTIVSDNSSQAKFWDGHAFLLYESYINDTLDFSGFARGFKYTEDGDGTIKNNWNETPVGDYKISPNRVISIGNYSSGDDGWDDISGSSGSGSSGSSSSSGSGSSTGEGNGIHFNMELRLLYSSEDGTEEGAYVRSYGNNAALTQPITANQLESMLEYENTVNHYNFVGNNCAEIAGKSWNKAFDDDIDFRIWTSTPTPAALKKSIENRSGNFKISFHSNEWKDYINKEVVDW